MLTTILNFLNVLGLLIVTFLPRNNFDFFYNEKPIGITLMVIGILIGVVSSLISSFRGNKSKLILSVMEVIAFPILVGIKILFINF